MPLHILAKKYNFKVKLIKLICIFITIFLLITILCIAYSRNAKYNISLNSTKSEEKLKNTKNSFNITKAQFYSTSNKEEPFELFADKVLQVNSSEFLLSELTAILFDKANQKIIVTSNEGFWFDDNKILRLKGDININIRDEYTITSKSLNFNLNEYSLRSEDVIKIKGKGYELNAMGFDYKKNNSKINFIGPINFKIQK